MPLASAAAPATAIVTLLARRRQRRAPPGPFLPGSRRDPVLQPVIGMLVLMGFLLFPDQDAIW
jgi:hypothetical protein